MSVAGQRKFHDKGLSGAAVDGVEKTVVALDTEAGIGALGTLLTGA